MVNGDFNTQDIFNCLNSNFPSWKDKIPTGVPSNGVLGTQMGAFIDNTKTREILGFQFTSFEKSFVNTAEQILKVQGKI